MASFLSKLFGGGSKKDEDPGDTPQMGEAVTYKDLTIRPAPIPAGSQWRVGGVIVKAGSEGDMERQFDRADTVPSREDAENIAITKAKHIIDEQGDRLFADGAPSRRV